MSNKTECAHKWMASEFIRATNRLKSAKICARCGTIQAQPLESRTFVIAEVRLKSMDDLSDGV